MQARRARCAGAGVGLGVGFWALGRAGGRWGAGARGVQGEQARQEHTGHVGRQVDARRRAGRVSSVRAHGARDRQAGVRGRGAQGAGRARWVQAREQGVGAWPVRTWAC